MKRIRILHIINSLGRRGGAEKQLALELGNLCPGRFESSVCYLHPPAYLAPAIEAMGIPVYSLNIKGKKQWPAGVWKLRKLIKTLDVDLIHTCLHDADILGGVAGKLTGVPVLSTLTNSSYEIEWLIDNPNINKSKLAFSRLTRALIAKHCNNHVVAISESVKTSAVRQLGIPEEKVSVIYRALSSQWTDRDCQTGTKGDKERNGLPEGYPILINTGRLEPQKGQRYLIEAMPRVLAQFPNSALVILGEGSLQSQLDNLAQDLGVQDHVFFLGHRSDVRQLLESSDIFVFPSLYEGLGNALIEAMARGLPSVVSNIETSVELTQDGELGVVTPARDSRALAEAVIKLASSPEEAKLLGLKAQAEVLARFAVNAIVDQRMEAYELCLPRAEA